MRLEFVSLLLLLFKFGVQFPGGDTGGETPLPIPNRVVKPSRADGTALVTAWESRSLPGLFFKILLDRAIFLVTIHLGAEKMRSSAFFITDKKLSGKAFSLFSNNPKKKGGVIP